MTVASQTVKDNKKHPAEYFYQYEYKRRVRHFTQKHNIVHCIIAADNNDNVFNAIEMTFLSPERLEKDNEQNKGVD